MTRQFQKWKICGKGSFSISSTVCSCTTKPLSSQFWLDNAEENVAYLVLFQWWGDDRQVSQSGKPLCTGASLWAVPKLARGLCPLEPRKRISSFTILSRCSCFCRFKMFTGHSETIETSQLGLCPAPSKGASLPFWNLLQAERLLNDIYENGSVKMEE